MQNLQADILWLEKLIKNKVEEFNNGVTQTNYHIDFCEFEHPEDNYSRLLLHFDLNKLQRSILIVSFCTSYYPVVFDSLLEIYVKYPQRTNFGGFVKNNQKEFIPTIETCVFLFGINTIEDRKLIFSEFEDSSWLIKNGLVKVLFREGIVSLNQQIFNIGSDYLNYILTGEMSVPDFSTEFPAKRLVVHQNWTDLVLPDEVMSQLSELIKWQLHANTILYDWGFRKILKQGYRSVLFGPSGTGKSMAAGLIGKELNVPVFKIDLSKLVSKYIGETEKNLDNLFNQAENKDWILFFDEAESLFSKRSTSGNGNSEKFSNQLVGYLLQRIEDFSGLIILSTNLRSQMDEAFLRRFQSFIYFPLPDVDSRLELWKQAFRINNEFQIDFDLKEVADKYELTGGMIINVVRNILLELIETNSKLISDRILHKSVLKEFQKNRDLGKIQTYTK